MDARRTIELKIPSEPGYEKVVMKMAEEVAEKMGFTSERIEDLKTAVSEACMNAIEHGNQFDVNTKVFVILTVEDKTLAIDVKDEGRSGPPPKEVTAPDFDAQLANGQEIGGMGLFLIKSLVDQAEFVEPEIQGGNQFRMLIHLQTGEHSQTAE